MFKSSDDIKKTLLEIRKLKDYLDDNIKNPNLKQKVSPEMIAELNKLTLSLNFFKEFTSEVLKSVGLDDKEINKNMQLVVPDRDPQSQELFEQADALKCELLISQAKFYRENYREYLETNRPFQKNKSDNKEGAKKKIKKKFKTMNERMKWNKM